MSDGDFKLYLNERFDNLTTNMNAHFRTVDERLEKIEVQTTKTNGRVTELEKWRSEECGKMSESARLQVVDHNARTRVLQTIGIFISACAVIVAIFLGVRANNKAWEKKKEEIVNDLRKSIAPTVITRGSVYDPITGAWYIPDSTKKVQLYEVIDSLYKKE